MRTPKFTIRKFKKRNSVFYGIWVPAYLRADGAGKYAYFHTKADAERKRGELIAATRTESKVQVLDNAQTMDALRAIERLAENGITDVSLEKVVMMALPLLLARGQHVTVDKLCADFAAVKAAGWSKLSARNFASVSKTFLAEFSGTALSDITAAVLEDWLSKAGGSAGNRNFLTRTLRPAFSWAVRRDMLSESPFGKLEKVKAVRKGGVDVFTPDEARNLMGVCPADCVASYALLLFAGIRPDELKRLHWGDVRADFVHISPAIAKTAQVRNVSIEPNLRAWLDSTGEHAPDEPVCPANWSRKSRVIRKAAGIGERRDTARHSYASYWLAMHKDEHALKLNMGHSRGSDTLFVHYRAAVTPAQAAEYWGILPQ